MIINVKGYLLNPDNIVGINDEGEGTKLIMVRGSALEVQGMTGVEVADHINALIAETAVKYKLKNFVDKLD